MEGDDEYNFMIYQRRQCSLSLSPKSSSSSYQAYNGCINGDGSVMMSYSGVPRKSSDAFWTTIGCTETTFYCKKTDSTNEEDNNGNNPMMGRIWYDWKPERYGDMSIGLYTDPNCIEQYNSITSKSTTMTKEKKKIIHDQTTEQVLRTMTCNGYDRPKMVVSKSYDDDDDQYDDDDDDDDDFDFDYYYLDEENDNYDEYYYTSSYKSINEIDICQVPSSPSFPLFTGAMGTNNVVTNNGARSSSSSSSSSSNYASAYVNKKKESNQLDNNNDSLWDLYHSELQQWNDAFDVFKQCLPCKAYDITNYVSAKSPSSSSSSSSSASQGARTETTDVQLQRAYYRRVNNFNCHLNNNQNNKYDMYGDDDNDNGDDGGNDKSRIYYENNYNNDYNNGNDGILNQCMRFSATSPSNLLTASVTDVEAAGRQGTISNVKIGHLLYGSRRATDRLRFVMTIFIFGMSAFLFAGSLFRYFSKLRWIRQQERHYYAADDVDIFNHFQQHHQQQTQKHYDTQTKTTIITTIKQDLLAEPLVYS